MSWGAQPACKVWEGQRPPGHSIPEHHVRLGGGVHLGEGRAWEKTKHRVCFCTVIKITFWKSGVFPSLLSPHPGLCTTAAGELSRAPSRAPWPSGPIVRPNALTVDSGYYLFS